MSFLELSPEVKATMKIAEAEAIKGFAGDLVHQTQDLLKKFGQIDMQKLSSNLPDMEIVMSQFQASDKKTVKQHNENKTTGNQELQAEPIPQGELSSFSACTTKNNHYEQYIVRDNNGRVMQGKDSVPIFEYDDQGGLKRVTTDKGTIAFRATTYTRRPDGKWIDQDGSLSPNSFSVDQTTGEMTCRYVSAEDPQRSSVFHKRVDGTSYTTDASENKLISVDNGSEHRQFTYDEAGNLKTVFYRRDRTNPFGQDFRDSWSRQSDGSWVNLDAKGKPTGRRLADIQCQTDGTYIEVDFPCHAKVFPLEPARGR